MRISIGLLRLRQRRLARIRGEGNSKFTKLKMLKNSARTSKVESSLPLRLPKVSAISMTGISGTQSEVRGCHKAVSM
jgi:hypothetical protein